MIDDKSTTDTALGVQRVCPCRLHRLPKHPSTYPETVGLLRVFDLCCCECDHTPDEERWVAA